MTEWQKIKLFDKRIVKYEEHRESGFAGLSLPCIFANAFAFVLMCVPFKEIFWELGVFWTAFHGLLLFLGGYWRMKWLLVLSENGKIVPWKEYLKYVPVDWKSYRCHRYQVLLSYTGKKFLCFVIIQMVFQILSKAFMGTELSFEGIAYAAAMCSGSILLPGVFFIWKCC